MDRKLVYILLLIIIICSSFLIYKINQTPKYDKTMYSEVYKEYEKLLNTDNEFSDFSNPSDNSLAIVEASTSSICRIAAIIDIPKINISYPVINDYSESNLNIAPTKFAGPEPNQVGNFVIAAHNNRDEEFFANLHKLEKNDIVYLTDKAGNKATYTVYDKYEVKQNDLSCISQNTNKKAELTLLTCVKYNKNQRLIVKCILN